MPAKPLDPKMETIHTYWNSPQGFCCPLCDHSLEYAFNDGGRVVQLLNKSAWIITNYYRCTNSECKLHESFPIVYDGVLRRKKHGLVIWEKVIRNHFKYHMDYAAIVDIMWQDWEVSISKSTVKNICAYFESAGQLYLDEKILADLQANGEIIVSLDGAQPKKGEPALWIFSDRITGHVLYAVLLDVASAEVLQEILEQIQARFRVSIKAVISDKQRNIVKAVNRFNPEIPHIICQYHFLKHIAEPIQAKDSHLATQARKRIGKVSIVVNRWQGTLEPSNPQYNPLYATFNPLAEELLNAVAVQSKPFEIYAGIEIYENLRFIGEELAPLLITTEDPHYLRTIRTVLDQIHKILTEFKEIYQEILQLMRDFNDLRRVLGKDRFQSKIIKKEVQTWVYRLQSRLKRRGEEFQAERLKFCDCTYNTLLPQIWQEWVRLEASYHDGIYYSYDNCDFEKTNNPKEQLIGHTKYHFKKWLGQSSINDTFQRHGGTYSRLSELDFSHDQIYEVLWAHSVTVVQDAMNTFEGMTVTIKRNWHIRDHHSGNLNQLKENLVN